MSRAAAALLLLVGLGCAPRGASPTSEIATPARDDATPAREPALKAELVVTGEGEPIVIVGNALTGIASWAEHAERLRARRRVARAQPLNVTRALAGEPLPPRYSVKTESAALAVALDELGWTAPVDLVGWSWGGLIALDLALDHPERVRSLVLAMPNAPWLVPPDLRGEPSVAEAEARARRFAGGVSDEALAEFMAETLGPGSDARAHPRWQVWSAHREALRALPAAFDHREDPARLARLTMPVLIVRGERSGRLTNLIDDALVRALPRARVVELPGGQMAPVASIARFLDEMERFQTAAR